MVLLTTTPRILSAISALPASLSSTTSSETNSSHPLSSLPKTLETPIDHKTLIALSRALLSSSSLNSDYTLNTLLLSTRPYHPPPPPPPTPSPEYLALKAKLLAEQERRAYHLLLHPNANPQDLSEMEEAANSGEDDISPSLVFNILLSIVLCAYAIFHVTRHWRNDGLRVLCSLGAGIVVGVAEVGVYAGYLRKVDEARRRERRKKERKEVIGEPVEEEVVLKAKANGMAGGRVEGAEAKEEETIWGKGVNGGVRRRVRERWEKEQEISSQGEEVVADVQ